MKGMTGLPNNRMQLTAPRGRHCWLTEQTSGARVPFGHRRRS
jgi:hypothetical protein